MSHALLQKHCLKKTKLRLALLNCFIKAKHAQSYAAIKKSLGMMETTLILYVKTAKWCIVWKMP